MIKELLLKYTIDYLQDNRENILLKVVWTVVIFLVLKIISKKVIKLIKQKIEYWTMLDIEYLKKTSNLIGNIILVFFNLITILLIFLFLWFDVALIIWWISIALWFAMETTIKNTISWILMITNKKVQIWDFIEILWDFNIRWTIIEINMRNTIIKTVDKRRILIPNWQLIDSPIKTLKIEPTIRFEFEIKAPFHSNTTQIKNILITAINNNNLIKYKNFTNSIISWFDEQWIIFKSFFYFSPQSWSPYKIASEIKIQIHNMLKKYWIKTPYIKYVLDT